MPHFSDCGKHPHADTYICQVCGHIRCSECVPSEWRPDITGNERAGNVCRNCLNTRGHGRGMKAVTKSAIKAYLKKRLKEPKQAIKALMLIYSHQTAGEQATDSTSVHNNMGFSSHDAFLMSKFAKQYQERKARNLPEHRWLSKRQIEIICDVMPKYWNQVRNACSAIELEAQVLKQKAKDEQQLSLELKNDGE